jgi:2-polyprenyl-6-hydroxyphenyl methylase/3-demethylubiquinone-9 3-methyltransferase
MINASSQPNIDPDEIGKFDALASRWWDPDGEFKPLHRMNPLRLAYLDERAGLAGKRCLDVGCGGGLLSEGIARQAAEVIGIDMAPAPLAVARLHAAGEGLNNVSYRQIDAENLATEAAGHFDLVTCLEVLEHVPDPQRLVSSLATLVRPGGDVIVSTLNRTAKAFALGIVGAEYITGMVSRGTHQYERFIRPSELEAWGRASGLQLADLRGIVMDLLSGRFRLDSDVDVNYLAHFQRPASV